MTIQLNTDHNIKGSEKLNATLTDTIMGGLGHYGDHITRVEVHLTDENGAKTGVNDKRCVLEARFEGRQPVVVTSHANTVEQAVDAAIEKMNHSLDAIVGKMKEQRHVDKNAIEDLISEEDIISEN